ncbi:HTH domain-containing protein [Maribellus comscasis]|nr:HTH domain-containing protein [Maribellus comscasis]
MKALEQLERLKRMNQLIKAESTGTPDEFSNWLGISRRQLYSDIEYINDIGVKISYSKNRRTFYYCNAHELEISVSLKVISKETIRTIDGGFLNKKLLCAFFVHGTNLI